MTQQASEVTKIAVKIPIKIEGKRQNAGNSSNFPRTSTAVTAKKGNEEIENFTDLASGLNLKLKETNIETEKCENTKTPGHLKSCLKSDTKTKIPISIKIPIRHESSPIHSHKTANADCQTDGQDGRNRQDGQDIPDGPDGSDGQNGPVHSVSTQTDKDGCSVM